jgi:hypothetical protein
MVSVETVYKPLPHVEQNDLEFLIPGDSDTNIDLDIKLYVRGKMVSSSGKDVYLTDTTAEANNLLHSLFSQCTVILNRVPVTQSHEHHNYRAYLESLLTYGTDAASSHLSNSYWYLDNGDMQPSDPMAETHTSGTNNGFIARWSMLSSSRDFQLFGRLHTDLCNIPLFLLPRVLLQIKLKKARPSFYLMNKSTDTKTTFKFLDAYLLVRHVQPNPVILEAQEKALENGALARYNMTRVDLKTFTFSTGSKSRSIDNEVLGPLPKRLLFTMIKNTDFNGSVDTNPYKFRHYISEYSLLWVHTSSHVDRVCR